MSHWAELDNNNKVIRVLTVDDSLGEDEGYTWLIENFNGIWIKTSYNNNIRKHFAGIGYTYNAEIDAFLVPKPFESWILNTELAEWEAPEARPNDENEYLWNEDLLHWELVTYGN
jgi:hypothetical protein